MAGQLDTAPGLVIMITASKVQGSWLTTGIKVSMLGRYDGATPAGYSARSSKLTVLHTYVSIRVLGTFPSMLCGRVGTSTHKVRLCYLFSSPREIHT